MKWTLCADRVLPLTIHVATGQYLIDPIKQVFLKKIVFRYFYHQFATNHWLLFLVSLAQLYAGTETQALWALAHKDKMFPEWLVATLVLIENDFLVLDD